MHTLFILLTKKLKGGKMKIISVLLITTIRIYGTIKGYSPWVEAKRLLALYKYTETYMFKERARGMGEKFALEGYINKDWKFFMEKISWKEKLDIFLRPYTYISKYEPIVFNRIKPN